MVQLDENADAQKYRYFTVLRLALPRASIKEIVYQGIRIPKGTVYFLNAWACNMGS